MGFYQQHILPHLIHGGMRHAQLEPLRSSLIDEARGRVLEIGVGSGLNIPFYRRDVFQVIGIDPSRALLDKARRTAAWSRCPIKLLEGRGEALPLASGSIDHVVMTWTLCSVADPIGTLSEIRRVLRPAALSCSSSMDKHRTANPMSSAGRSESHRSGAVSPETAT